MKINESIEWHDTESLLRRKAKGLSNEKDILKMIGNIQYSIKELSKAEVISRQRHSNLANNLLEKINNDIEMVEEFLLVAAILG